MKAGFTGPGAYIVCPVFDCDWKIRDEVITAPPFALFTKPTDTLDEAINRAILDRAAELEATIKAHINDGHPEIVTDLMRTIRHLANQLAAKDPGSGVDIRLDSDQGNALYRWLEDTDLIDTKTGEPAHYWETPLAPVQQQLSAWLRTGGGWNDDRAATLSPKETWSRVAQAFGGEHNVPGPGWPEGLPPGWTGTSVPGGQVDLEAGG